MIAGASVTVKGEGTGLTRSGTTNSSGVYTFTDLPVGSYQVEVSAPGFKASVVTKILLNVADVRAVDVSLATGQITDSVTVEVPAISVQTSGGEVAGLITGEQVRELPLNGRNFLQLALLMPGVSAPDFLNVKDKGLLGGSDLSVSGSAVTANMWTVDGASNSDVVEPHDPRLPLRGRDRGLRSTATTAPSSARPPGPRSTSSPAEGRTSATAAATTSAASPRSPPTTTSSSRPARRREISRPTTSDGPSAVPS